MRKPMMAGNWKMNNTWAQTVVLTQQIINKSDADWEDVDVVICPATCNIKAAQGVLEFDKAPITIGAQNVHWEESGAFTGEASIPMITEIGATYCIVGHSERREYFGETDEMVNKKVHALLDAGIVPIVCVGESLGIRDSGDYLSFICSQVKADLAGIEAQLAPSCVVAYEPVWAIGTGRTATPEQAQEVCASIRSTLAELFDEDVAQAIRILYGGSCNPANVEGLIAQADIDGGLIGGAALKADDFAQLVEACK